MENKNVDNNINKESNKDSNLPKKLAKISIIIATILLISFFAILIGWISIVSAPDDPSGGVPDLKLTLAMFIGTLISFSIVFGLGYYFFWDPMNKHLETRKNNVKTNIDAASYKNKEADELLEKAEKNIDKSKSKGKEIVSLSKREASQEKREIIDSAKSESNQLIESARVKIEKEKSSMKKEVEDELITTSLLIAEKIIEKEIDAKTNEKMINDLIKKLEE